MSTQNESNGRPSTPDAGLGVLSNLPRTRPQRSTARRTAARKATAEAAKPTRVRAQAKAKAKPAKSRVQASSAKAATPSGKAKPASETKAAPRTSARRTPASATRTPLVKTATSSKASTPQSKAPKRATPLVDESVPRQGFESDMDRASGPVQPPGGAELVATAAEIVSELAKAGVSTGERLFKDLLGHLPLS
jgi:hypothetical protein